MPLHSIPPHALSNGLPPGIEQATKWCAYLEAGLILYFPQSPVPVLKADFEFLSSRQQATGKRHQTIAYNPVRDRLCGFDHRALSAHESERLRVILRRYSDNAAKFLEGFLAPYERRWRLDRTSFQCIQEAGRNTPLRRRNDLLHIDAFPARPTRGWRILRFFQNVHPTQACDWVVCEPFPRIVEAFCPAILAMPRGQSRAASAARRVAEVTGLADLAPRWMRTPYDRFMLQLHNAMKQEAEFQRLCHKVSLQFAPGSSWMVYTETVPHAIRAGQFALEQTLLVDPAATVTPDSAPLALLEKMADARLA